MAVEDYIDERLIMPTTATASENNSNSLSRSARHLRKTNGKQQGQQQQKRDIEFMHHNVKISSRCLGEFGGNTHLYAAKDDDMINKWRPNNGHRERRFLVKVTYAETEEEARRAQLEVKLLRKLRTHPNLVKLIDCGFSTIENKAYEGSRAQLTGESGISSSTPGSMSTGATIPRMYFYLFEPCPDRGTLDQFIRQKQKRSNRHALLFGGLANRRRNKEKSLNKYLPMETVLSIFSQMCLIVKELHLHNAPRRHTTFWTDTTSADGHQRKEKNKQKVGIIMLSLEPQKFIISKQDLTNDLSSVSSSKSKAYDVKLCSFGCAIPGRVSLRTTQKRENARRMIESSTDVAYRSPEMLNLHLHEELTHKSDIWSLGCCLYELLFLKQAFGRSDETIIGTADYEIPSDHPYNHRLLELLGRLLEVDPNHRPDISNVCEFLELLKYDYSLDHVQKRRASSSVLADVGSGSIVGGIKPATIIEANHASIGSVSEFEESESELESSTTGSLLSANGKAFSDSEALNLRGHNETASLLMDTRSLGGTAVTDGSLSESTTEGTAWLEFDASSKNSTVRRGSESSLTIPTGKKKRGTAQRQRRQRKSKKNYGSIDPLDLGAEQGSRRGVRRSESKRFADWTLGVINRLSNRSLTRIDPDQSVNDESSIDRESLDSFPIDVGPDSSKRSAKSGLASLEAPSLASGSRVGGAALSMASTSSRGGDRQQQGPHSPMVQSANRSLRSALVQQSPVPSTPLPLGHNPILVNPDVTPVSALTLPATPVSLPTGMSMRGMLVSPREKQCSKPQNGDGRNEEKIGTPPASPERTEPPSVVSVKSKRRNSMSVADLQESSSTVTPKRTGGKALEGSSSSAPWSLSVTEFRECDTPASVVEQSPVIQSDATKSLKAGFSTAGTGTTAYTTPTSTPQSAPAASLAAGKPLLNVSTDGEDDISKLETPEVVLEEKKSLAGTPRSTDELEISTKSSRSVKSGRSDRKERKRNAENGLSESKSFDVEYDKAQTTEEKPQETPAPPKTPKSKLKKKRKLKKSTEAKPSPTDNEPEPQAKGADQAVGGESDPSEAMVDIPRILKGKGQRDEKMEKENSNDTWNDSLFDSSQGDSSDSYKKVDGPKNGSMTDITWDYSSPGNWAHGEEEQSPSGQEGYEEIKSFPSLDPSAVGSKGLLDGSQTSETRKDQPVGQASSEVIDNFDLPTAKKWMKKKAERSAFETGLGFPKSSARVTPPQESEKDDESTSKDATQGTDGHHGERGSSDVNSKTKQMLESMASEAMMMMGKDPKQKILNGGPMSWTQQFYLIPEQMPAPAAGERSVHSADDVIGQLDPPPLTKPDLPFEPVDMASLEDAREQMRTENEIKRARGGKFKRSKSFKTVDSNIPPSDDEVIKAEVSAPPKSREYIENGSAQQSQESLDMSIRSEDPLSKMTRREIIAYHRFQRSKGEERPFSRIQMILRRAEQRLPAKTPPKEEKKEKPRRHSDYVIRHRYEVEDRPVGPEPYSDEYYTSEDIPLEIEILPDHAKSFRDEERQINGKGRKSKKAKRKSSER